MNDKELLDRYRAEIEELAPYRPLLEIMKKDPNLIQVVKSYFEGKDYDTLSTIYGDIHIKGTIHGKRKNPYL